MTETSAHGNDTGPLDLCQDVLAYRFGDRQLLVSALSHSSIKAEGGASNERLEFLGDAILGMVASEVLYKTYPEHSEGELTRVKSAVVSRRTLAKLARRMGLQDHVLLGRGMAERKSLPVSVLSNVLEAVIAAVYLDGGIEAARHFVLELIMPEIEAASLTWSPQNFKSLLQQYVQRRFGCAPTYRVVQQTGPNHKRTFHVVTVIEDREYCAGTGKNKKEAEQHSAEATLERLKAEQSARQSDSEEEPVPSEEG